jgi:hypothetical protein
MGQEIWNKVFTKHLSNLGDIGDSSKSAKKGKKAKGGGAAGGEVSAEAIREMLSSEDGIKQLTEIIDGDTKKQKAIRATLSARNKAWADDFDEAIAGQTKAAKLDSGYEGPDVESMAGEGSTTEDRILDGVEKVEKAAERKNLSRSGPREVRRNVADNKRGQMREEYVENEVVPPLVEEAKRQDDIVGLGEDELPDDPKVAKSPERKTAKTLKIGEQEFFVKSRGDARSRFDNMPKPTRSKKGPDGKVLRDEDGNPIEEPQTLMQQKGISDKQLSMSRDQFVADVKNFLKQAKPTKADGKPYKLDEVLGMNNEQLREFAMKHRGGGDLFSLTHFDGEMKKGHEPGSPKGQESAVNKSMTSSERLQHETARRAAGTDPAAQRGRSVSEEEAIEGGIPLTALPQSAFGRQSASATSRIGDGIDGLENAFGARQAMQIRAALSKLPDDEAFTKAYEIAEVINTRGLMNTERTTPRADIDAKFGTASAILASVGKEMGVMPRGVATKANKATRATGDTASNPPVQPDPVKQAPLGEHWRHDWQQADGPAVDPSADPQPSMKTPAPTGPEYRSNVGGKTADQLIEDYRAGRITDPDEAAKVEELIESRQQWDDHLAAIGKGKTKGMGTEQKTPVRKKFDPNPVKQTVPRPTIDDIGGDGSYLLGKKGKSAETEVGVPDEEAVEGVVDVTNVPRKRGAAAKPEAPAAAAPARTFKTFKDEYSDLLARARNSDGSNAAELTAAYEDIHARRSRMGGVGTNPEVDALVEEVAAALGDLPVASAAKAAPAAKGTAPKKAAAPAKPQYDEPLGPSRNAWEFYRDEIGFTPDGTSVPADSVDAPAPEVVAPEKTPVRRGRKPKAAVSEAAPADVTATPSSEPYGPSRAEWANSQMDAWELEDDLARMDDEGGMYPVTPKRPDAAPAGQLRGTQGASGYDPNYNNVPWPRTPDQSGWPTQTSTYDPYRTVADDTGIQHGPFPEDVVGWSSDLPAFSRYDEPLGPPRPDVSPSRLTDGEKRFLAAAGGGLGIAGLVALRNSVSMPNAVRPARAPAGPAVTAGSEDTMAGEGGDFTAAAAVAASLGDRLDRVRSARERVARSRLGLPGFLHSDTSAE